MAFFSDLAGFNIHHVNFNAPYSETPQIITANNSPQPFSYPGFSGTFAGFNYSIPSHDASYDSFQIIEGTTGTNADYLAGDGLVFGANGTITGGTMSLFENNTSTGDGYIMGGFSMNATDYSNAAQTATKSDDVQVFNSVFTGNDLILLQNGNDTFNSGNGADFIYDTGGRNTLSSGNGSDVIISGDGKDVLDGGAGNDLLVGGGGNDSITGDAGNDTIWGGAGDDTLNGGTGADHFVFVAGDGKATIESFAAADDQLMFVGPTKISDLTITQHGLDTHITFGDISITLTGVDHHTLTKANFNFHADTNVEASLAHFLSGWDYIS